MADTAGGMPEPGFISPVCPLDPKELTVCSLICFCSQLITVRTQGRYRGGTGEVQHGTPDLSDHL